MSGKFRIKTVYCEGEAKIELFKKAAGSLAESRQAAPQDLRLQSSRDYDRCRF
jgi:hypothetical protein